MWRETEKIDIGGKEEEVDNYPRVTSKTDTLEI